MRSGAAIGAWTCIAALSAIALWVPPSATAAAPSSTYDPVLSLTGSCGVDSVDPFPDPGQCPGTAGFNESDHPPVPFSKPCGVVTDRYGDIYVANPVEAGGATVGGIIDVFNPKGEFLSAFEVDHRPCGLAVDSKGNVYVGGIEALKVTVYHPNEFPPTPSTKYTLIKELNFGEEGCLTTTAVAVDPSNDHLYVNSAGCGIREYGSEEEGLPLVREISSIPGVSSVSGLDVRGKGHEIYVAGLRRSATNSILPARFVVLNADGSVKCEVSSTESGAGAEEDLDFGALGSSLAVNQLNGDAYVFSLREGRVNHFRVSGEGNCAFVDFLPEPFPTGIEPSGDVAVDAPIETGEPPYKSPNEGYIYVTSGTSPATSRLLAFESRLIGPPQISKQVAGGIGESEAVLMAQLSPGGLETTYHFEYTTQASFEKEEYSGAASVPVPDGVAGAGGLSQVSAPVFGLEPGTRYRFRLVASNCEDEEAIPGACLTIGEGNPGGEGSDAEFTTFPAEPRAPSCPNGAFRTGPSAALPDCRAYELVTPADTGGHIPTMSVVGQIGYGDINFDTPLASQDGEGLVFGSNSGALPGLGGSGGYDTYEARRGEGGWQSRFTGMSGAQAEKPIPGGISADHRCALWNAEIGRGTLVQTGHRTIYTRCLPAAVPSPHCSVEADPGGTFEWLGCGSLGFDTQASGNWISEGGGHVIFTTGFSGGGPGIPDPVQLEPCAPPDGVRAIYDRTPGGPTRCISVPPAGASAETEALFETESPVFEGASTDGSAVAFSLGGVLYARLDDATTVEIAAGKAAFGGFSADGRRAFYLAEPDGVPSHGEIYACEVAQGSCAGAAASQSPIQVGEGGESIVVNISADGSRVYFVSPELLDGEAGAEGGDNLYVWDGEAVHFVAVLDPLDLSGAAGGQSLGFWVGYASDRSGSANDPSRSTPDGSVLVFQSHAELTGQDGGGHWQLFRYDSEAGPGEQISCLSCSPIGAAAGSDASLQVLGGDIFFALPPVTAHAHLANVSPRGDKVVFQSADRLVSSDVDGKLDVYEWEGEGVGGCQREGGCLALLSGGRSSQDEYLYAMSPDAHDVFFLSSDSLLSGDPDPTPSVYDAREGGGFPESAPPPAQCTGEACQPVGAPPEDQTPASTSFEGKGNPRPRSSHRGRCAAASRAGRRAGRKGCHRHRHVRKVKRHRHRRAAK